jgi:hypothetical protein
MRRTPAAYAGLAVLLFIASAASWACGFHSAQTIAQVTLNLRYPDALHVSGAVWSAQQAGSLPLDRKRLRATGAERKLRESRAFLETSRSLYALGASFQRADAEEPRPDVALVLVETMLWTRYPNDGEIEPHVSGPEPADLVVVTDEPVVRAVADGQLAVAEALEQGLLRLYGPPDQTLAFAARFGDLGAEPLPPVDDRILLRATLWGQR